MRVISQGRKAILLFALFFAATLGAQAPEVGDFVFRSGTGRESAVIRQASNSVWSHIGVVVATRPDVQIVHATTHDDPAHPNQVIMSSYAQFAAPHLAKRTALARPLFLPPEARQALADALRAQIGKPFILTPRDQSPRYCTTIIFDVLQTLAPGLPLHWQRNDWPLLSGEYLFPQAFADLPQLQWLEAPAP